MPKDEFEHDDPMELVGMILPGDEATTEAMAETFVEEYVRMGWDDARLMKLFTHPFYVATHAVYRLKGEAYVRELIRKTCAKWQRIGSG
ncbi:MAG TPA: hypothetical protein VFL17_14590 [Anaerolineae bacterium]|nr:hypothetical protein [Anaerolineae bacterium]